MYENGWLDILTQTAGVKIGVKLVLCKDWLHTHGWGKHTAGSLKKTDVHCAVWNIHNKYPPLDSRDSDWKLTRTRTVLLIDSMTSCTSASYLIHDSISESDKISWVLVCEYAVMLWVCMLVCVQENYAWRQMFELSNHFVFARVFHVWPCGHE